MPRFNANITLLFQEYPIEARFAAARTAGFHAVELLMTEGVAYSDLAAAAKSANVEVALCNISMGDFVQGGPGLSAVPARQQDFRQATKDVLELARVLSCPRVHIGPSRVPDNVDRVDCYDVYVENVAFAAEQLACDGVQLTLEPLNNCDVPDIFLCDMAEAYRIMTAVNLPNLALQLDIYHQTMMGQNIEVLLKKYKDDIAHIQFADAPGRAEPGQGDIDFEGIFKMIDDLNYQGWVGAEYSPSGRTEDSLEWLAHFSKT